MNAGPDRVLMSASTLNMRRQLEHLAGRLRDPRYAFLFEPGPWAPDLTGMVNADLGTFLQDWLGLDSRLNALVAGVALSFAIIPVVFTVSEEAFGAVPPSYVEASTALGAARWQTILRVLVPAAGPGVAAGIALGLGRAVGETMIVLMASGNAAIISASPGDSVRTISATIAAELAEVVFGGAHYTVLFFLGVLLFAITFATNLLGDYAVNRMKRRLGVAA